VTEEMATTTTKSDSQSSGKAETILVTGATGTVGSEVVKQLLASPHSSSGHNLI
jgi:FlaA1/EpsC-like NDP-sugar epimerase